jgi:hypothetical protein
MVWTRSRRHGGRRPWPLLGLLLVVAFLGHDVLMAAEATAERPHAVAHYDHGAPAHTGATAALPFHGPPPEHPTNCRVGQSAVARSGDALRTANLDTVPVPGTVAIIATLAAHGGASVWQEPRWPPGTLRALFQVYRI